MDINVDVIYGANKIFASHQNMLPRSSKTMHTGRYCCSLMNEILLMDTTQTFKTLNEGSCGLESDVSTVLGGEGGK